MLEEIIQVPYLTSPKMERYTGASYNLISDKILSLKKSELDLYGNDLYGTIQDDKNLVQDIAKILNVVNASSILELGLEIEEDIAIMVNGKLHSICFCFPSSWIPSSRIGQTFKQIHEPVADNSKLIAASDKVMKTIAHNGPFKRYVWTLTNNPILSNHPKNKQKHSPSSVKDLYFRYETQTTFPIPNLNAVILFVNVKVEPLSFYWDNAIYKNLILDSINSMTDSVLTYKQLHQIKNILNHHEH